jgi:hypothetical protein
LAFPLLLSLPCPLPLLDVVALLAAFCSPFALPVALAFAFLVLCRNVRAGLVGPA